MAVRLSGGGVEQEREDCWSWITHHQHVDVLDPLTAREDSEETTGSSIKGDSGCNEDVMTRSSEHPPRHPQAVVPTGVHDDPVVFHEAQPVVEEDSHLVRALIAAR